MGLTRGSQRALLILPFLLLFASMTVVYGAGLSAKITSPADKAKVNGTVEIKAQLTTSEPVAYVLLVVDGTRPISMNAAPWTFQLDTRELANGPHEVSVEAYDSHALIASSKVITVYTNNQTSIEQAPPVVVAKQQPSTPKATAAAPAPKTRAAKPAVKVQTAARTPKAQVVAPVAKTQATVPTPKVQAVAPAAKVRATVPAPKVQAVAPVAKAQATVPTPKVQATAPTAKAQTTVSTPKAQAAAPAAKVQATVPTPKAQAMAPAAEIKTAVPAPKVPAVVPAAEVQTPVPAPTVQAAAPAAVEAPTTTAAFGTTVKPTAIAAAETIATGASAAPIVTMRGPAPEPTRTASLETPAARSTDLAKAETSTASASVATPSLLTPPKVKLAQSPLPHFTSRVIVNGKPLTGGVTPRVVNGRMHSGFRALFAAAGARVDWLPGERTARAVLGSVTVDVPVGSRVALVNGREVDMGGIATIKDGRTVVPLRFFAQATDSSISWNAQTGVASVQTPTHALASVPASIPSTANMPGPDNDSSGMRTLIFESPGRAP